MIDDWTYKIHQGDCLDVMRRIPDDSVDLIVTSPPYANRRKDTYGGVSPDNYVDWFLPRSEQMRHILKPTGSFVLNIKEGIDNGSMETYVLELILALVKQGWRWACEYIWVKPAVPPRNCTESLKNEWERLLHFAPSDTRVRFFPNAVRIMASEGQRQHFLMAIRRRNAERRWNITGSGVNMKEATLAKSAEKHGDTALPGNVVMSMPAGRKQILSQGIHPVAFPDTIPAFFIRLMTEEGDVVLDPFSGSGTTYRVAQKAGRKPSASKSNPNTYDNQPPCFLTLDILVFLSYLTSQPNKNHILTPPMTNRFLPGACHKKVIGATACRATAVEANSSTTVATMCTATNATVYAKKGLAAVNALIARAVTLTGKSMRYDASSARRSTRVLALA